MNSPLSIKGRGRPESPVLDLNALESRDDLQPLERSSLAQQATELIRRAIVEGILRPGEDIGVRDLARRVNVSPTPIREALIHLAAIGLVEFRPGRVQIAAATAPALRDAFELREALEGMAARLAAMRRTDAEADLIRELASRGLASDHDQDEFRRLDNLFHRAIGKAARSAQVERYMTNALDLALTLRNVRSIGRNFRATSSRMHVVIADAIVRQAPDEAEAASRQHVREVCEASTRNHKDSDG
jgi:DNA-binding GntR family transcriptional regulator